MDWQSLYLLELILVRMAGFMLLNPLFGRGTIPGMVKLGFAGVLALFTFSYVPGLAPPALPATVLEFSLHLLLELAAELLSEVGMGILMKAIPQINAFVINIELKVIVGLVLLLVFLYPMNEFVLGVEKEMLQSLERALGILAGAG